MFNITFDYMLDGVRHSFAFDILETYMLAGYAIAGYFALAFLGSISMALLDGILEDITRPRFPPGFPRAIAIFAIVCLIGFALVVATAHLRGVPIN
jgi:hypothetical protein